MKLICIAIDEAADILMEDTLEMLIEKLVD
jgi:hypothetical protein